MRRRAQSVAEGDAVDHWIHAPRRSDYSGKTKAGYLRAT